MIDRALLNGALLPFQSGFISKCSGIHSFLVLEAVHSLFYVEKRRPHFSLAICLCSHFHGALCIWRVTNQVRDSHPKACKHQESSSPTRHVSFPRHSGTAAQRVLAFLFPVCGLFLRNSQKKVDSSSHTFTAVLIILKKGHAKLL